MDTRLSEIAHDGDVPSLTVLIKDNPLILDLSSLSDDNNPLHIDVMASQVGFAREILRLKPELVQERNQDGFTPLHIVSAKGDVVMAKEILKLGDQLCLTKGREGRIPLHYAAIKGRVLVMEELLLAQPDSVEEVTARRETAVHLAVRNTQFEAFRMLAEHLKKTSKEAVLNWKDSQGNTALHLAATRKDYEVIQFMVSGFVDKDLIEVNAQNHAGLTALDLLLLLSNEAGDMEIVAKLMKFGASRATGSDTSPPLAQSDGPNGQEVGSQGASLKWTDYFKFKKDRDSPKDVRSVQLVIAALILTATYQAALKLPGDLWQDNTGSHQVGKSIIGTNRPVSYLMFLVSNSLGFFASILIIQLLTDGMPMHKELTFALYALVWTYDTLMAIYSPNTMINIFFIVISIVMPILVPILYSFLYK